MKYNRYIIKKSSVTIAEVNTESEIAKALSTSRQNVNRHTKRHPTYIILKGERYDIIDTIQYYYEEERLKAQIWYENQINYYND